MDEELDETLAPLVDALTGAMAAVLLVSIFMMLNTMSDVAASIKEYGQQALYENQEKLYDIFERKPPELQLEQSRVYFFKSFKMTEEQKKVLFDLFAKKTPTKIIVYSNESENISTLNLLTFLFDLGLKDKLDNIKIEILPAKEKGITEFTWE